MDDDTNYDTKLKGRVWQRCGHRFPFGYRTVGDTPMIRINRLVPPGSRDRVRQMRVLPAAQQRQGSYRRGDDRGGGAGRSGSTPDTHIIEPTSGNTGIALAFVCAAKGYRLTLDDAGIDVGRTTRLLRAMGANLVLTPAAEGNEGRDSGRRRNGRSRIRSPGCRSSSRIPPIPAIHESTTGPEIWEDSGGQIDAIVAGVGTGGTITGVARYIKSKNPDFKAIAVEPKQLAGHQRRQTGQTPDPGHRRRFHPEEPRHVAGG